MPWILGGAVLLIGAAVITRSAMAERTPEPRYEIVRQHAGFEVRRYAPVIVAETVVEGSLSAAGNEGFRRLAGFIFGGNRSQRAVAMTAPVGARPTAQGEEIAMTAPVGAQAQRPGRWLIRFVMPAEHTMETLPQPLDPSVKLRPVPERLVAAVRFSGAPSEEDFRQRERRLRDEVAAAGLAAVSEADFARYDPPWRLPWFRRNEILLEVKPATTAGL